MKKNSNTEGNFLDRSRIALTNAQSDETTKALFAKYGYNDEKFAEGWKFFNNANDAIILSKTEKSEENISALDYKTDFTNFIETFKEHRDKTRILCKKQPEVLIALGITGAFPVKNADLFSKSKLYYQKIKDDTEIQAKLALLNITPEVADATLAKRDVVLKKRSVYYKESGESEEATKLKAIALLELKEWIEDFDIIAKIALYNQPQLLESLGIFVRS